MKYLLDTNLIIYFLKGTYPQIGEWLRYVASSDVFISAITIAELEYGARGSNNYEKNMSICKQYISAFQVLAFDHDAATFYGDIRNSLKSQGSLIGTNNMLIAASALSRRLVVATHNVGVFERVDNLLVFDPCVNGDVYR